MAKNESTPVITVTPVEEDRDPSLITSVVHENMLLPEGQRDEIDLGAQLDPNAAELARTARRPDISMLEDATVTDPTNGRILALFQPGDRLVIERYTDLVGPRVWLDTQTYEVRDMDDDTGKLSLWNPDLRQCAVANFITGQTELGHVFKIAPRMGYTVGGKKRGRPRKNPVQPVAPVTGEKKRGRGRPKGSKNRPKEVIAAEKIALKKERSARAASRKVRKLSRKGE